MEGERNKQASVLMWTMVAALLSQNLLIPVMSTTTSVEDQKNYYSPDPHAGSPPTGSHGSPSHGTTPSHGSGGNYGTPPSHGTPSHGGGGSTSPSHGTPSHGGGGSYGGSPPSNCGNPPSGHYNPTPSPPSGGYSYTPPISGGGTPTPITLTPPTTPIIVPGTPVVPGTPIPGISVPSPPYVFDPNSPPFSCNYWRTHPALIWGLFGWFGTMGGAFGAASVPGFGSSTSLQQALSNVRTDGYGALYREGTASLLNSMVDHKFPLTSNQVRDNFISALRSDKSAAAQAHVFKLANEGRLKP